MKHNATRLPSHRTRINRSRQRFTRFRSLLTAETLEHRIVLSSDLIENLTLPGSGMGLSANAGHYSADHVQPKWFQNLEPQSLPGEATAVLFRSQATQWLPWQGGTVEAIDNEWIVQLSDMALASMANIADLDPVFRAAGLQVVEGLGSTGQLLIDGGDLSSEAVAAWLRSSRHVASFEPNTMLDLSQVPNDSALHQLWGLNNSGQTGGAVDADIDAPEAWNLATGSASVVVGVIDTGVDYTHPDLAANMWRNPGEIAGNHLDDDGNGFIDDVYGYDFANNDSLPMDDNDHGTHVAGTIAAVGDNGIGVAGVTWTSSIMALKFLNASGRGSTADAVRALNYATMMRTSYGVNVRVTNNSWGSSVSDAALYDAIRTSGEAGMLFVAAAGNDGGSIDRAPRFPAVFNLENIITVAATDHNDALAAFSNYGRQTVDIAAPGVDIYSTLAGGGYGMLSGTSMAAPHVAGAVALAWSLDPDAAPQRVKQAVMRGSDYLPSVVGVVGSGRLNLRSALHWMTMGVRASDPANGAVDLTPRTAFTIDFTDPYDPASVTAGDLTVNEIPATSFTLVDGDTITFHFANSPIHEQGLQTMGMQMDAVTRLSDQGGFRGWQEAFYYDETRLTVAQTQPAPAAVLTGQPTEIVVHFNEPVDPGSIDTSDLVLDFGTVVAATVLDVTAAKFTVTGLARDGSVTYALPAGRVSDLHGSPNAAYTGSFVVDDPLVEQFAGTSLPMLIPDLATIYSTVFVDSDMTIADLDVQLTLEHAYVGDLEVYLIAPDGTEVELFAAVGGGGRNFTGTIFDDEATQALTQGIVPFTGRFRPAEALSRFDGFNASGTWMLRITDGVGPHSGELQHWSLIVARDVDAGPRISSVQPLPADGGDTWRPIDTLTVRFSEVMDPATVNDASQWELVEAGPDRTFDTADDAAQPMSFATPYTSGLTAQLRVDAGVLPVGKYRWMAIAGLRDRLGNALAGDYARHFVVKPRATVVPFLEDFEAGSLAGLAGYWQFDAGAGGRIEVTSSDSPHGGLHHLILDEFLPGADTQTATLHLDLRDRSGLTLDFWQKAYENIYDGPADAVEISADGQTWSRIIALTDDNSEAFYQHHVVNLDAAVAAAGMTYTADFQIRFTQNNYVFRWGGFAFDDIRLSQADLSGPRIVAAQPAATAPAPFDSLYVTFDEPIDPSSHGGRRACANADRTGRRGHADR